MIYSTLTYLHDCHMETNTAPSEVFLTKKTSKSNYSHQSQIIQFDIQTSVRATSIHVMLWHRENTELGTSFSHLWKRSLSLTCKTTKGLEEGSSEHPKEDVPSVNMKGTERKTRNRVNCARGHRAETQYRTLITNQCNKAQCENLWKGKGITIHKTPQKINHTLSCSHNQNQQMHVARRSGQHHFCPTQRTGDAGCQVLAVSPGVFPGDSKPGL